jgi:hypothetical protein
MCDTTSEDILNSSDYKTYPKDGDNILKSICMNNYKSSADFDQCSDSSSYTTCYRKPCVQKCPPNPCFNNPDISTFKSIITPLSQLTPLNSKCAGAVEFMMRRKNKVVSLQFEPFKGILTVSGIAYLELAQSICNFPPYPVSSSYTLSVNGVFRQAQITVNPCNVKSSVWFYLNADSTATGIMANDSIVVNGGCISWIVA